MSPAAASDTAVSDADPADGGLADWRDMTMLDRIHAAQRATDKLQDELSVVSETLDRAEQVVVVGERVRRKSRTIVIVGVVVVSAAVAVVIVRRRRKKKAEAA